MDTAVAPAIGESLTASFEKIMLSGVRLSGAATLYGVQQLESAVTVLQERDGISKQMDRFGHTFNSLTQCLAEEISPGKKDALTSFSDISVRMVRQSLDGMSLLDPRGMFRIAGRLARRSSDAVSGWSKKKEEPVEEQPRLAADVLGA